MVDVLKQRKITLNSLSGGDFYRTGSTFLVEYSLDCVNYYTTSIDMIMHSNPITHPYTGSIDWNRLTLSVGQTGSVLIPKNSTCMRLTDVEYPTSQYVQIL